MAETSTQERIMKIHPRHLHLSALLASTLLLAALGVACSDDEAAGGSPRVTVERTDVDDTPYQNEEERVVVVNGDDTYIITGDPGDRCVELDTGECVDIGDAKDRYCDDAGAEADIILVDGEVVDVICYPDDTGGTPIEEVARDDEGNATVPQNANGAVITFNEDTDEEPIEGDLDLQAERVSLWGNGVDVTILDGNVTISSNNSRVRGVTVTGNLSIAKNSNNAAAAFCKIHGKLTVESNGATIANCQVFGDVKVTGNDVTLINIGAGAGWDISDKTWCSGCYSIDDADDDFLLDDDERGEDLTCARGPAEE